MWRDLIGAAVKVVDPLLFSDSNRAGTNSDSAIDACADATSVRTEFVEIAGDTGNRLGMIGFEFASAENVERRLISAKRDQFKIDFCREIARLEKWAADLDWVTFALPKLHILVSDRYEISKSLVPAWSGLAGRMEFPVRRVISRQSAIAHELTHVFFPSSNRFLAEGLAVYIQATIGGNPAFPNFGMPLHECVRDRFLLKAPAISRGDKQTLEQVHLAQLDAIATPGRLRGRVGHEVDGDDWCGPVFTYPVAGSFVQFLIETRGVEMFRALYEKTPLVPFAQKAGSPDRWLDVFGAALSDLEDEWKSMIADGSPKKNRMETIRERISVRQIDNSW